MPEDYWILFWKAHGEKSMGLNSQARVLRTRNKLEIDNLAWKSTLDYIQKKIVVDAGSVVLDLCAGTGVFSREFAESGAAVVSVDISSDLLHELDALGNGRIKTMCQDMRKLEFGDEEFSHIFLYAGIQYLTHAEAISVFHACYRWLKPGGRMMIGDIPDVARRWVFYDTAERKEFYFENLSRGVEVIGTWFERDWLRFLFQTLGFDEIRIENQPNDQIYSDYRFDIFLKK